MTDAYKTAPIGPETVTVNHDTWRKDDPWSGFDWRYAEPEYRSIWGKDYHLRAPWRHPDDTPQSGETIIADFVHYRVRLKRGWKSFVRADDGTWLVSTAPRPEEPR